ncbi:hypothetical protein HG535_0F01570 [Zygotorulaspora mrakii]|uniref:Mitochondrial inner membrane protein COX18 n=1 Tax=Zygotorulaspora mrakii TaxID=42260 RepID=A0A7H9B5K2_ZYGMR|nr:uncharacterized protein HG535_0F01570 [Zygotorulaspora mrakii]QLG73646.1 hypothetical protein HG535_0F01570 [Zygotorulaspora mrakii]
MLIKGTLSRTRLAKYKLRSHSLISGRRHLSVFQNVSELLVTMHDTTGLTWLTLVPLTTITLRTLITLPLSILQRKRTVKQQQLRKLVQAITPVTKLRLASVTATNTNTNTNTVGDTISTAGNRTSEVFNGNAGSVSNKRSLTPQQITLLAVKETRNRQKKLFARYSVQMWKNIMLPIVQVPLWVTISMGIRGLTDKQLLETNSYYWFSQIIAPTLDLSLSLDSMPLLIPMVLGTLSLANVEYNGKVLASSSTLDAGIKVATNDSSRISQSMNSILNISRFSCVFMMGISSQAPLILSLYWISSQLYSFIQNVILNWLWPYQR